MATSVLEADHWDVQYRSGPLPWDTGRPSAELARMLTDGAIRPCRVIELGCGTGTNAIWLAGRHFEVTAVDLSRLAIRQAIHRAARAGVCVRFRIGDLRDWRALSGPFDFFFDRGCYHAVRLEDPDGYFATLDHILRPAALGLVLLGNDREPETPAGPPGVGEATIRREFGRLFDVLRLREFRFDASPGGQPYLGWSCLLQRIPARAEKNRPAPGSEHSTRAVKRGNDLSWQAQPPLDQSPTFSSTSCRASLTSRNSPSASTEPGV